MAATDLSNDELVAMYVKLRDAKATMEAAHKKAMEPYTAGMEKLESILLGKLNDSGTESMRTNSGTFFKKKAESVTVASRETFYDWAVKNGQQDLLDIRAAKVNILAYKDTPVPGAVPDANGVVPKLGLPPGLDYRAEIECQVRRGK